MRLSVSTEAVTVAAAGDAVASAAPEEAAEQAPAVAEAASASPAATNGAAPVQDGGGIRGLFKTLSGRLAGGNASNGNGAAPKASAGPVDKVRCLFYSLL